uniref:PIG-L family deacetylase n=1 Tax=candidate division WOR-3 bacterium TaxID=2052148 RepID=A0A7C4GAV9_UNCW3
MTHFKSILFLGAHTDDEFGCSGTLARLLEEGADVHYAAFSQCEQSVPPGFAPDVLRDECRDAALTLGISEQHWTLHGYPVRHFPAHRQQILEDLVRLRDGVQPDLLFVPALSDIHQDHQTIAQEALRAFKHATILGYELPMNTLAFQHACFVHLESRHIDRKVASLACYRSQNFRSYTREDFIRGLARVRGVQAGVEFAEAFEVIRWNWR